MKTQVLVKMLCRVPSVLFLDFKGFSFSFAFSQLKMKRRSLIVIIDTFLPHPALFVCALLKIS